MLNIRSFACLLVATGIGWACSGNANSGTSVGASPVAQQPSWDPTQPNPNPNQPATNSQQPPTNPNQPGGSGLSGGSGGPGPIGLDCNTVCGHVSAAGYDAIAGSCAQRCAATSSACSSEIQSLIGCFAASPCVQGDVSEGCQGAYDTYLTCEQRVVGSGGAGGNGAGGNGAGGDFGGGTGGDIGAGGSAGGGACTQTDGCASCTGCDICTCLGLPIADCGC